MEGLKKSKYRFSKVFLYRSGVSPKQLQKSYGTVRIEFEGNKGSLKCRIHEEVAYLVTDNSAIELVAELSKPNGEQFRVGRLLIDETGTMASEWKFSSFGGSAGELFGEKAGYRLLIIAVQKNISTERKKSRLLLEGFFDPPFEIKDDRIVGFSKEAKVEVNTNRKVCEKNPLFQKVEPFQPPIPNSVWWQISIQPAYSSDVLYTDYCPRRKPNKAIF